MAYVFGGVIVAEDEETAKSVAYGNYSRCLCVTVKGDKYNPQGTLEGGFNKNQGGLLMQVQKYQEIVERKSILL